MIERLLRDEIRKEFEKLNGMEVGTEEYEKTIQGLVKLIDKQIDFEKFENEKREKDIDREFDQNFKRKELRTNRVNEFLKHAISVTGIGSSLFLAIWGTKKSFEFEKEGTITTIMGRGFINKLIPKKWW